MTRAGAKEKCVDLRIIFLTYNIIPFDPDINIFVVLNMKHI